MKDRISAFLKAMNISAAKLADDIGVQRSGISHILMGRNNPSLDFAQKLLKNYPELNPDWLLLSKGSMFRDNYNPNDLFNRGLSDIERKKKILDFSEEEQQDDVSVVNLLKEKEIENDTQISKEIPKTIKAVITLFSDNSFDIYYK